MHDSDRVSPQLEWCGLVVGFWASVAFGRWLSVAGACACARTCPSARVTMKIELDDSAYRNRGQSSLDWGKGTNTRGQTHAAPTRRVHMIA